MAERTLQDYTYDELGAAIIEYAKRGAAYQLEIQTLRARLSARSSDHQLQDQLLDLLTLMPDSQTQELVDYIMALREIRAKRG